MTALLADIGGTNTRCAVTGADGKPAAIQTFKNADHDGPAPLLASYLDSIDTDPRPHRAVIGVAAPVRGDVVRMINLNWHWSADALRRSLELDDIEVCNDFEALALSLPELEPAQLAAVGGGQAAARQPKVVLGPGTGLGVAALIPTASGAWQAVAGEGGHVTMAGRDRAEDRIIERARARFGHCSAERLISGPGLRFVHAALHGGPELAAEQIGRLADDGDAAAAATLELVFRLLGTVAGDLAVTLGAFGGIYLGGGIVPRHRARFVASGFRERFEDRGRYRNYLSSIATSIIVADAPALLGLAARAAAGRAPD